MIIQPNLKINRIYTGGFHNIITNNNILYSFGSNFVKNN
jgi:hypothetical protein